MKTLLTFALLTFCLAPAAFAQTERDSYPRFKFYGGFSTVPDGLPVVLTRSDGVPTKYFDDTTFKGFELSGAVNVARFISVKGRLTGLYETQEFHDLFPCPPGRRPCIIVVPVPPNPCPTSLSCPTFKGKSSAYEFLGGLEFEDNASQARIKPFAHVLAGVARASYTFIPNPDDPNPPLCPVCQEFSFSRTGFAAAVGGGLDVRLNRRFDLRVLQLDYNPTHLGGQTQHHLRLGTGLVIH